MKKSILSAVSWVAFLTLIAKGLGMLRDILQARVFGATAAVDLFTAANNYTIYIYTTVAYALCLAAVPIFSRKLAKSREETFRTADKLLSVTLLAGIFVTVLMFLFGATGLFGDDSAFRGYVLVMALTLPLILMTYLLMALFQAMGHYSLQGSLSLLYNVGLCSLLLILGPQISLMSFAVLSSIAWILQLAMTIPFLVKERYRFHLRIDFHLPELGIYLRTAIVTAFTTAIFLFCYLIDCYMAAELGDGVVSGFFYADKLFTPITTTLIYSIGAVVFPKWSEQYEKMTDREYRGYVGGIMESTILLLLPLSAIFAVFGVPIVRVLFEGGNFDVSSSMLTGSIFSRYALGMVGFAMLDLMAKAYYAMCRTIVPFLLNIAVLAANVVINGILIYVYPSPGAFAFGTALVMTLGGLVLFLCFLKGHIRDILHFRRILSGVVLTILLYFGVTEAADLILSLSDGKLMMVLKCVALGAAGFGAYLLLMGRFLLPWRGASHGK